MAATLAVSVKETELLAGYMAWRERCDLPAACTSVFVTLNGKTMTQSLIANALTTAFAASGFSSRVNCTMLRKATVTQVHTRFPDKRADVAAHMLHRTNSAEATYRIVAKSVNTVACTRLIRSTMVARDSLQGSGEAPDAGVVAEPYQRKILWSIENRDLVRIKFDSFVQRQKTPIKEIEAVLLTDKDLLSKLESDLNRSGRNLVSAVKDKVRSFFRSKYGFGKR